MSVAGRSVLVVPFRAEIILSSRLPACLPVSLNLKTPSRQEEPVVQLL